MVKRLCKYACISLLFIHCSISAFSQAPEAVTWSARAITESSAELNGLANANNGGSTTVTFEYGTTTAYGNSVTAVPSPVTGSSYVDVSATITGLNDYQTYHYRVVATNATGTDYGDDETFTTLATPPSATTAAATSITKGGGTLNGIVNANGHSTSVVFEYGEYSGSYRYVVSATPGTVNGSTDTPISASIGGLLCNQTIYYRVRATNAGGTVFGEEMSFTTQGPDITVSDASRSEGGLLSLTVHLSHESRTTTYVYYSTADDMALAGEDYTAASGSVSIPPRWNDQHIRITTAFDNKYEPDETFFVNLTGSSSGTIVDSQAIVTILNDDSVPQTSPSHIYAQERGVTAICNIRLSNPSYQTITVDYKTADSTATSPGDYLPAMGTATFNPGETSAQFRLTLVPDTVDEADERFYVEYSNPTNATLGADRGIFTILDDDPLPKVSINNASATETDSTNFALTFTVTVSGATERTITVDYATEDGSAKAGVDYASLSGALSFAPGETSKNLTVLCSGDVVDEFDETFTLNLSNPVNATILDGQGVGTIMDNDPLPSLLINNDTVTEGDSGTKSAIFTVRLSSVSEKPITIDYSTSDVTAEAGTDYTATSGTLNFTPGTTTQTISVPVIGETVFEELENFLMTLSNPVNATILVDSGYGTIINNDPFPVLSIDDPVVTEGNSGTTPLVFTVSLTNASYTTIYVDYSTADGTATVTDNDYVSNSGTVIFSPGTLTRTVQVAVNGDRNIETDEAFTCILSHPVNCTMGDNTGSGTITNDDWNVTVSGVLTDRGNPLEGATVTFSHDGHTETTAADGSYSYTFLNSNTTTVTPSHPLFVGWNPTSVTFDNIQNDQTADFAGTIVSYDVSTSIVVDGTVSFQNTTSVNHGDTISLPFVAETGHHIGSVSGCDGTVFNNDDNAVNTYTYTTGPITGDCQVTAAFAINRYSITATSGTNGTITPAGTVFVNHGEDQAFLFEPDDGYRVADILVDGVHVDNRGHYLFRNVTEDHTIHAVFDVNEPPVIDSLTADPIAGNAVLDVTAVVTAHDPDGGEIVQYQWAISGRRTDATVTREPTLAWRFVLPGDYQISLTVVDADGGVSAPATVDIDVAESAPLAFPLPTVLDFDRVRSKADLNVELMVVNVFDETALITLDALDAAGTVLETHDVEIPAYGTAPLSTDWITEPDTDSVRATADRYVVVTSRMTATGRSMTAYLDTDLQAVLTAPHIAESVNYWNTLTYLSNSRPDLLDIVVAGTIASLMPEASQVVDTEAFLDDDPSVSTAWGTFTAHASDAFSSPATLTGFEMFVMNNGDGAAVELQHAGSQTLYIPHVPEETDLFWTGFAIVNPGDTDADAWFSWYDDEGQLLGTAGEIIPAGTKLKYLIEDLFPEFVNEARWGVVSSNQPLVGIEIFGTPDGAVCGLSLPGSARTHGILPELNTAEDTWSGFAVTNVISEAVTVTVELVGADGEVKDSHSESIAGLNRFKAVVADYFTGATVEAGDYVRFTATGPVVAIGISGDDDRTVMSALTAAQ